MEKILQALDAEIETVTEDGYTGTLHLDHTMSALRANCRGVRMAADKRRLNLSFSMASPLQREAWEILRAVPSGQRTETVCRAVCRMYEQDALPEVLRQIIREELQGLEVVSEKEKTEQPPAGDVDESVLGFLLALQKDGGEE